ncbi:hypothetical protein [Neorhizobium sp. JUb45]|uniref:hypothetical protein n=1 Tax=unclassified Neorhizobium TaxID=2629175 RepID=UPI00104C1703|nr:hypothetical protein [Neorhizobium sp. JUb45]TCR01205.1 hypothetical protein EDF70_105212 [Neorhizobium sp. JUb45]
MMAKSIFGGMTAALLFVCAAPIANASDRSLGSGNGPLGNNISVQSYNGDQGRASRSYEGRYPSYFIRHGSVAIVNARIYGRFVSLDDRREAKKSITVLAPKAKIIDVDTVAYNDAFAPRSGCVMESGVCVIRGDR